MRKDNLWACLPAFAMVVLLALTAAPALAQATVQATPAATAPQTAAPPASSDQPTLCGAAIPAPANLPPTNMGPVIYYIGLCFDKQGGFSVIEAQTYLYYIQTQPSLASQNSWKPWNEEAEQRAIDDGKRLWATNFLDDFSVEVEDYHFTNGVIGKVVSYHMEERQRIKNVSYVQAADGKPYDKDGLNRTKFEEKLRE